MTYMLQRYFLLMGAVFLLGGIPFLSLHADGLAVKVQPSMIDEVVDPGQVLEGDLTITNTNGGTQTYFITTRNVVGMSDTGTPSFDEEHSDDPLEASAWVKPQLESVTMDVGQSVKVPYRIEVPQNASPGSYFAAFFVTREAEEVVQSGAGVGFHVASLINLRVAGDVNEDMLFREFSTGKSLFTNPSVYFNARIDNTGSIHQRPVGMITINNMLGKKVGQVTFNDAKGAILPHYDRVFDVTWNYDGFALGRYTAIASIAYGESESKTATKELTFWIIPIKEVGIAFGLIATLLLVFVFGIKRYIRNALRKAGYTASSNERETHSVSFARRLVKTAIWLIVLMALVFIGMLIFFA